MFDKTHVKVGTILKKSNGTIGTVIAYNGYYPLRIHSDSVVVVDKYGRKELFSVSPRAKTIIIVPEINLVTL